METITLLACGHSATQVDLRRLPGCVIAVNDSMRYAPRWDIGISMDRLWIEHRWNEIIVKRREKVLWLRACTMKNVHADELYHVKLFDNCHTSTSLSDAHQQLNGTHSGFCALNLAYQMRPRRLYLVGFDMARGPRDEAHWFPQYPWVNKHATGRGKLAEWSQQFVLAAAQLRDAGIETRIVADRSILSPFRRISPSALNKEPQCA